MRTAVSTGAVPVPDAPLFGPGACPRVRRGAAAAPSVSAAAFAPLSVARTVRYITYQTSSDSVKWSDDFSRRPGS